ncbi:unnamed protein product [Acanthoscelides obtectus]|uniref:Uncharacterized protein n=1 Tax=Acanthoscelides obtectus TaxID=200917 RepID=A0A9P0QIF1_ACAOB|nr:unnamed protein product [Acanthoscelides obtectus]CAK1689363.1 hypothetical protein AOBTE_LOCUS37192 [Acanthoscelides obtectus]
MKCTLQEVGQGQPSSSTQAASLQKDIPIVSPMKTHQILTEIYPWTLEGSRLSTPSPEFASVSATDNNRGSQSFDVAGGQPGSTNRDQSTSVATRGLDGSTVFLTRNRSNITRYQSASITARELFQIENLDHLVSHITQKPTACRLHLHRSRTNFQ